MLYVICFVLYETMQYIILSALIILIIAVLYLAAKKGTDASQNEKLDVLQDEIKNIREEMKGSMEKNFSFLQNHTGQSNRLIQDVTVKLSNLESTNKQVVAL